MEEKNAGQLNRLQEREKTARKIFSQLNKFTELKPALGLILGEVKTLTNCQAVAVRLHDQGDYPYYVYDGFSKMFIQQENRLCFKDEHGDRVKRPSGEGFVLDCMCGNVIHGLFDSTLPIFTATGSFWTNCTSDLLTESCDDELQGRTRNYCNTCGYESVALVPIKSEGENIGLIQLNDMRSGMFTQDLIEFMEMIGEQVGLAVQNTLNHTKLKESLLENRTLSGLLTICSQCKKIRDESGEWQLMEHYHDEHPKASFTHGYCPDCAGELHGEIKKKKKTDTPFGQQ